MPLVTPRIYLAHRAVYLDAVRAVRTAYAVGLQEAMAIVDAWTPQVAATVACALVLDFQGTVALLGAMRQQGGEHVDGVRG
jgi:hypothetical protein